MSEATLKISVTHSLGGKAKANCSEFSGDIFIFPNYLGSVIRQGT